MRVRKINGTYHKVQRNKLYPITTYQAKKLIKDGAEELKEIKLKQYWCYIMYKIVGLIWVGGAIVNPAGTKVLLGKSVDFIHALFNVVIHYMNTVN